MDMTLNLSKSCSFDLFDTLTTRWYTTPASIWEEMSVILNDELFVENRQKAHYADSSSLDNIYNQYQKITGVSDNHRDYLKWVEALLELDRAAPIRRNIKNFKPGDYIISDMYLPENVIRLIIRRMLGDEIIYQLILTPNGKNSGRVWPLVANKIKCHIGDNYVSDVQQANRGGVTGVHYTDHEYDNFETTIQHILNTRLHMMMRLCRLNNPYGKNTIEADIWDLTSRITVPMNILYSVLLMNHYNISQYSKILFITRDCYFLKKIFSALYPDLIHKLNTFNASRATFKSGSLEWKEYATKLLQNSVCIDYYSSGKSIREFTQMNNIQNYMFISLVKQGDFENKNHQYLLSDPSSDPYHNSKGVNPTILELINNTTPFGTCVDYIDNNPVRLESEHNAGYVQVVDRCVNYAVNLLNQKFDPKITSPVSNLLQFFDQINHSHTKCWGSAFKHLQSHEIN